MMLTTLPTELVLHICEEIPAGGLKVVRLVCRDLNDLLRQEVMSAVVFNIHRDNLDLSLLENLAEEDDVGGRQKPIASLVRRLTIYSLSPPYSVKLDGGPGAIRLQKHSTRLDSLAVAACEKRLLNVLGRSLYALKHITHLKCAISIPQPTFVERMIQGWYEEQLESLVRFELLPRFTCRIPHLLSRLGNPHSLSSLRNLTYTSLSPRAAPWYINSRQDEELSLFLSKATGLTKLEIINTLTHTLQLPALKPNNPSQLAISTLLVRDISYFVLTPTTLASLTPSLTSLHVEFFSTSITHPIGTSMVSMGNPWSEIQPQHLKNLRSLATNGLCQNLVNRLSDPSYFVSLRILKLDFRGLSYLYPHPMTDMADSFFSKVVPALAERGIEELEVYHVCDCTPWSFRERDSAQYDRALKSMKRLVRFSVSVGVYNSDKDALSLVKIAHQHPCLRTLQIEVAKMSNCNAVLSRPLTSARYIESELQHFARAGNPADYPRVFLPGVLFKPYSIDNIVRFGVTYLSD